MALFKPAWEEALGADYGQVEFCTRHAEVSALLRDALRYLSILPQASNQRYSRYVPAWWSGVISPNSAWNHGGTASSAIDQASLDQLAGFGELLEARLSVTSATPAARQDDLTGLRAACVEWLDFLGESSVRTQVRDALSAQIAHLIWLIDNVDLFGVSRVAQEGQAVGGAVVMASAEVTDPEERSRWGDLTGGFLRKVAAFTVASQLIFVPALTTAADMTEQAERAVTAIAKVISVGANDESQEEQASGKQE